MSGASPEVRELIGHHPFIAGTPADAMHRIADLARIADFPSGTWLVHAGAVADTLHLVVEGRAAVELSAAGREPLVVATVHPGDVIGWSWFVEPHRWRFDVVALDDVRTLAVDASGLRALCEADHELGYRIAHRLAGVVAARLEATRHQLVDVYGHTN